MRLFYFLAVVLCLSGVADAAWAKPRAASKADVTPPTKQLEVTADQSLEYYQDQKMYVARGNAKATREDTIITADVLTAHERDKPQQAKTADKSGMGDIDIMTAEGHVVISSPKQRIFGDHAVYDIDQHKMVVTGEHLRYETAKETVTAHDSLEYYEDTKLAVARGHAVADQPGRHVEGDVLTAEFRDAPNGQSQLTKLTARGHVAVVTTGKGNGKNNGDVSRGDRAVYDAGSNVAIISGDVRITRKDGTQLSGGVGEVDFNKNENRLMNNGTGRVRALLPSKATDSKAKTP